MNEIPIEPAELEDVDKIDLIVRNVNGEGLLFTRDGRMIGHQIARMGHYYYVGHGKERVQLFRATFVVGSMPSDTP